MNRVSVQTEEEAVGEMMRIPHPTDLGFKMRKTKKREREREIGMWRTIHQIVDIEFHVMQTKLLGDTLGRVTHATYKDREAT